MSELPSNPSEPSPLPEPTKQCRNCGQTIGGSYALCPHCGAAQILLSRPTTADDSSEERIPVVEPLLTKSVLGDRALGIATPFLISIIAELTIYTTLSKQAGQSRNILGMFPYFVTPIDIFGLVGAVILFLITRQSYPQYARGLIGVLKVLGILLGIVCVIGLGLALMCGALMLKK